MYIDAIEPRRHVGGIHFSSCEQIAEHTDVSCHLRLVADRISAAVQFHTQQFASTRKFYDVKLLLQSIGLRLPPTWRTVTVVK